MAGPFTITSVSNYNSNPPSDDGAQTASNRVQWSTQKTKLADPIKTAFDTSETATSTAFGKIIGGAGITTTAVDYTVSASDQGKLVKATASGVTLTTPDATVVGSPFVFGILNASTGDITFKGNGTQTVDGDLTFTVPAGCGLLLNTDGSNWFTFGRDFNNALTAPLGRLTLTSGTPVLNVDTTAATSVFYTPFVGDKCPISTDGVTFKMRQFSELTLALVANHLASTIYDVFLFDNSGTITMGTGPAWNNSGAGTGSRGTGAGTTELQRVHGLWTNKNSMTARNGSTTYTVAANEGLYLGSISIDGTAGQVSCYVSYGQSRKWGVWNAYNRQPITLLAGDSTASWNNVPSSWRQSNNSSANFAMLFTGLAEESADARFIQTIAQSVNGISATAFVGIGINSTTATSGVTGAQGGSSSGTAIFLGSPVASVTQAPSLGLNQFNSLEQVTNGGSDSTYDGTQASMQLTLKWRG